MATNAQKIPVVSSLNRLVNRKLHDATLLLGKSWPVSVVKINTPNSTVTVKFELRSKLTLPQITVPIAEPQYVRYPIQPGDKGIVVSADAQLGGIDGLGTGVASMSNPANLGGLVFLPVGNALWPSVSDNNKLEMFGPAGVKLRNGDGTAIITLANDSITVNKGNASIVITSDQVQIHGTLIINGAPYLQHQHTDVQPGSSNSGPVFAPGS